MDLVVTSNTPTLHTKISTINRSKQSKNYKIKLPTFDSRSPANLEINKEQSQTEIKDHKGGVLMIPKAFHEKKIKKADISMQNIRMNRESVFKTIRNPIKMPSSINVDLKTIEKYQKSGKFRKKSQVFDTYIKQSHTLFYKK